MLKYIFKKLIDTFKNSQLTGYMGLQIIVLIVVLSKTSKLPGFTAVTLAVTPHTIVFCTV